MRYVALAALIITAMFAFAGCGETTDTATEEDTTILSEVPDPEPARHSNIPVVPPPAGEDAVIPPPGEAAPGSPPEP